MISDPVLPLPLNVSVPCRSGPQVPFPWLGLTHRSPGSEEEKMGSVP